jgi:hypothetical protein
MDINEVMALTFVGLIVAVVVSIAVSAARRRREDAGSPARAAIPPTDKRSDAYFKAIFPELQPWFHPENVVRVVRDRNGRTNVVDGRRWEYPSGFDVASAQVVMEKGREHIRLFDAGGTQVTEFDYEQQSTGGAIRIGRGKLTAVLDVQNNPRVRYWHPEREFKWSRKGGWQFTTPVAERPVDSNSSGSSFSSERSSSSSSGVATAAAAAGAAVMVSGAGGAFAGGGASEGWDDTPSQADSANAGATAY